MNMPERADIFFFQIKGMNRILKNHDKIPGFKKELFIVNIHGAPPGINQVNFHGFVDVLCKYIRIFPPLYGRADNRLRAKKNSSVSGEMALF